LLALAYAILTSHDVLNYNSILILFFWLNKDTFQAVAIGNVSRPGKIDMSEQKRNPGPRQGSFCKGHHHLLGSHSPMGFYPFQAIFGKWQQGSYL